MTRHCGSAEEHLLSLLPVITKKTSQQKWNNMNLGPNYNHDKRKQHNEPIRTVEAHNRRQVQENSRDQVILVLVLQPSGGAYV